MAIIATAGHVDHGKSSLVAALTGTDPDRLPDEKRRGMTLDLGFAFRSTDNSEALEFVDVPGHEDLIRTMIAGTWAARVLLLVIDAVEGVMPQTLEHIFIAEQLGVEHIVVALNKIDLVGTARLSKEDDVRQVLRDSRWPHCQVVRTSVVTGEGIAELASALTQLVDSKVMERPETAVLRPRLFVDRVFSRSGIGLVVTGTLTDGPLHVGRELQSARSQQTVRIREIQHRGSSVSVLESGHRCALNVVGLGIGDLQRGDVLIDYYAWWPAKSFFAEITVPAHSLGSVQFRGSNLFCVGTYSTPCRVHPDGESKIEPGSTANARIEIDELLALQPGDRFILRDAGRMTTVAGGKILAVDPPEPTWCTTEEFVRRSGCAPTSVLGEMFISENEMNNIRGKIIKLLDSQIPLGLASLSHIERLVVGTMLDITIERDEIRRAGVVDPKEQEILERIRAAGEKGFPSDEINREVARRLVNRGKVIECGGFTYHLDILRGLKPIIVELLAQHPEGFSVSHLRERLGLTRKFAVPLVEALDAAQVTRRVADVRIAGMKFNVKAKPE